MNTYKCFDNLKEKEVTATSSLSAIKKAFRLKGWHWEESETVTNYRVVDALGNESFFKIEDNG